MPTQTSVDSQFVATSPNAKAEDRPQRNQSGRFLPGHRQSIGNRGGAKPGEKHHLTHGVYDWLWNGVLPARHAWLKRTINELRSQVESELLSRHGEITIYMAAVMQTMSRHEGRALLLAAWLREKPDLPLTEKLSILKEIGSASDFRDRCLVKLGLDRKPEHVDSFRSLVQQHIVEADASDTAEAQP